MNDTPGWASPGSAPPDGPEPGASGTTEPADGSGAAQPADQPGPGPQWSKEQPPAAQWSAPTGAPARTRRHRLHHRARAGAAASPAAPAVLGIRRLRRPRRLRPSRRLGSRLGRPAARGQARCHPASPARRGRDPRWRRLHHAHLLAHGPGRLAQRRRRHADHRRSRPGLRLQRPLQHQRPRRPQRQRLRSDPRHERGLPQHRRRLPGRPHRHRRRHRPAHLGHQPRRARQAGHRRGGLARRPPPGAQAVRPDLPADPHGRRPDRRPHRARHHRGARRLGGRGHRARSPSSAASPAVSSPCGWRSASPWPRPR